MLRKYATNYIFVDIYTESMSNLLGDAHTAKSWIALLHLDNGRDQFSGRTFRAGFAAMRRRGKEQAILAISQRLVKFQQRCWLDKRGELRNPARPHEQRGQA